MQSEKIDSFRGINRFLSNFYWCEVLYKGHVYATAEHAFQAAKCERPEEAAMIRGLKTAKLAKIRGKRVKLISDWEKTKNNIMYEILTQKFKNPSLKQMLLDTKSSKLIEGNKWHDCYWGVCGCKRCNGKGENVLGETLMRVRREITEKEREKMHT